MSDCVWVSVSLCLSGCLSACVCLGVYQPVSVWVSVSLCLSVCVCQPVSVWVSVSLCLSGCLSAYVYINDVNKYDLWLTIKSLKVRAHHTPTHPHAAIHRPTHTHPHIDPPTCTHIRIKRRVQSKSPDIFTGDTFLVLARDYFSVSCAKRENCIGKSSGIS